MKLCLFVGLSILAALATAKPQDLYPRGCIYINGRCYKECEIGTHAYAVGCAALDPEPTCDDPKPVKNTKAILCDFSSCYCDPPTVRDKDNNKCVPLEECPKKEK